MSTASAPAPVPVPDPLMRAPRALREGRSPHTRLSLAPPALQDAVVTFLCRDTRGFELDGAQRLSHFPASPLVCLSWFRDLEMGLVEQAAGGPLWRPFGTAVVLSGSQSRPTVSWAPTTGHAGMVCFTADGAKALFGLDLGAVHDRFIDAHAVLGAAWRPFLEALSRTDDNTAVMAVLEQHLAARWQALRGRGSAIASLRQAGRHWVERLAWQALEWRRTHGPRQVERRIKAYSGRSLREWQSLVRTEGMFFAAQERYEAGQPFDWPALAQDEGFADQAHMTRAARRITGFSPGEFARRFAEDESFWVYRLWV